MVDTERALPPRRDKNEKIELVTICDQFNPLKHSTSLPYTFTKFGVSMSSLIKSLSLIVYNSHNNAHHSTCRVGGLFYWDNLR